MPNVYCCVLSCSSSVYQLKKWRKSHVNCPKQSGTEENPLTCDCQPPYMLLPFPQSKDDKGRWISAIGRKDPKHAWKAWQPNKDSRVCSLHFVDGKPTGDNPYPSLLLGHTKSSVHNRRVLLRTPVCAAKRFASEDFCGRPHHSSTSSPVKETTPCPQPTTRPSLSSEELCALSKHDHTYKFACACSQECACHGCKAKANEIYQLTEDIKELESTRKIKVQKNCSVRKLLTSDKKVTFYTGLPSLKVFDAVFNHLKGPASKMRYWRGAKKTISTKVRKFVGSPRKQGPERKLLMQDEFLLTLMRLRMDLMFEDIADRFNISLSSVSSIFHSWIKLMSKCLKDLIFFPPRDIVLSSLPKSFAQQQCKSRVIIDCSEVFIERPRDLQTQALTWSDYKHNNTLKFLVGITPQGHICYLSSAWGGRTSDREIVRQSGFLNHIDHGDEVMADRGFPIKEDLLLRHATLTIPPSAKGQEQMSTKDVETTKHVANLRIHVERAINRMKWFRILKGIVPITLMPCFDDILIVCGGLCNLLPPLVS